ncbi:MAG: hypothetical protein Q4G64_09400, partial [bacterium]|nr:hypothetical protein [bacterium]
MDTPVLLAVSGPAEPGIVRAVSTAAGLTVARRCADVTELLAVAATGRGALAVVSASHLGIDREVVERLHRAGVDVVGIASPEDVGRVGALGCDAVVESAAGAEAVVDALQRLRSSASTRLGEDEDEGQPQRNPRRRGKSGDEGAEERAGGQIVTVWGTTGSPGRTVVAANLARVLAESGTVCVVDADTRSPSLTQVLGIVEDSSGVAAASRAAANGRLDRIALDRAARSVGEVVVLTGLTRPDRWREVPASALTVVLGRCREAFDWTVVDVAGGWEDEPGDTFGLARDGAREAAVGEADVLVTVGAADPVGIWRLVELLSTRPRTTARDVVVVNKSRSGVTGPSPQHAVKEALARFAGVGDALVVPYDRAAMDTALLRGAFLPDVAPDSAALGAIRVVAS